jgi:hypothetical protein
MVVVVTLLPLGAPGADPDEVAPVALPSFSPDQVLCLVADDLRTNKYLTHTTRYLSLDDIETERERDLWQTITDAHLQLLSSEPGVTLTVRVGPLLRIDTLEYGDTFASEWERLGKQEPFWHGDDLVVEDEYEDVPYGFYYDRAGNQYTEAGPGRTFRATETRREKKARVGGAVRRFFIRTKEGREAFDTIQLKTQGTDVPVVRATWFLSQTAVSWQRDPNYYTFNGIKDLATFERAIGFVRKEQNPNFLKDARAATGKSGVTAPDTLRRIFRFMSAGGGYWGTQDADQRVAKGDPKANPLSNLGDDYKFQAFEGIGFGPNHWPKTALTDAKGVLQDRAPDNIAGSKKFRHQDTRVHINVACAGCHVNGYLQDVDDWVRSDLNADGLLGAKTEGDARKLRSQYATQYLEPSLKTDREAYATALWQVTKMKPGEFGAAYVEAWESATYDPVSPRLAARQLGTTTEAMRKAFLTSAEKLDIAIVPLRNAKPRSLPVVVWQTSFQRAADSVYGVARPFAVKVRDK